VLTVAGIYGPNASGKSNVVEALAWLASAVGRSLRAWEETVPRDPFKFGDGPGLPSAYEVEMIADGVRYAYQLEVTDSEVLSERLVSYPKRQPRTLFEREGMKIDFRRGLGSTAGARELLTPTVLALSAIMRFDEPEVQPFGRSLREIMPVGLQYRRLWQGRLGAGLPVPTTRGIFEDTSNTPPEIRASALTLLRFADLGIDNVELASRREIGPSGESRERQVRRSLNLERAYLQGRFGAVPELDQIALRRALDLAAGSES
jgi:uncharacterized protein